VRSAKGNCRFGVLRRFKKEGDRMLGDELVSLARQEFLIGETGL